MNLALRENSLVERSQAWSALVPEERRRRAVKAARDRDVEVLWSLTEAYLTLWGGAGARVSPHTRRTYRSGVERFLAAAAGVSLLALPPDLPASWVRSLEEAGFRPSSVRVWLAGARKLYAALRWAGAVREEPLCLVNPARDPVPPWERRHPYPEDDVEKLIAAARGMHRFTVLLAAHAGLRVSEICSLDWSDVNLPAGELRVRSGKGGSIRVVPMSGRLVQALGRWARAEGRVVERTPQGERAAMRVLCRRAGVEYRGLHSLRHSAGTRLYRETRDLEDVARLLGHVKLETTRVYAKWSDEKLRRAVNGW